MARIDLMTDRKPSAGKLEMTVSVIIFIWADLAGAEALLAFVAEDDIFEDRGNSEERNDPMECSLRGDLGERC